MAITIFLSKLLKIWPEQANVAENDAYTGMVGNEEVLSWSL
jgi:hypothetical protein